MGLEFIIINSVLILLIVILMILVVNWLETRSVKKLSAKLQQSYERERRKHVEKM